MGFISWYLFLLGFYGGIGVCILGVAVSFLCAYAIGGDNSPIWISTITMPLTMIPGLYCIWKSLNFATNLLIEEARKSTKDIFIINTAFIISSGILYRLALYFIPFSIPDYIHSIFIAMIVVFIVFKIILIQVMNKML